MTGESKGTTRFGGRDDEEKTIEHVLRRCEDAKVYESHFRVVLNHQKRIFFGPDTIGGRKGMTRVFLAVHGET